MPDNQPPRRDNLLGEFLASVERGLRSIGAHETPYWMKMGGFALVCLVLGLIGISLSARFEPVEPPVDTATSAPPRVVTSTTSTTIPTEATTTSIGSEGATTSAATGPAALEVSTESIDFGDEATAAEVDVTNNGQQPGEWVLEASHAAIAVSAGSGRLGPAESTTIQVGLDRAQIGEGDIAETITITWDGGQVQIAVIGTHEDNPIIHNPQASPGQVRVAGGGQCSPTQTAVSARVRDSSALESVVAQWSPDGSSERETALSPVGSDIYEGVIGPFAVPGSGDVRIVAFDERGNAGGAKITVEVIACP